MSAFAWTLFIHLIGFGMLFTSVLGAWILQAHYRGTSDWNTRAALLRVVRSIGLLSALAVVVMLLSGLGNIFALGLGSQMPGWLQVKLVLFVIAWAAGIYSATGGKRRTALVRQIADGTAGEGAPALVSRMDARASIILLLQSTLLFAIVVLSVFKP